MNRFRRHAVLAALVLALGAAPALAGTQQFLNIDVESHEDDTTVKVRVPISLIEVAIDAINQPPLVNGKIELELDDINVDWRAILAAIADSPDGDMVMVESPEADVHVRTESGLILIDVQEHRGEDKAKGDRVSVRLPMALVEAIEVDEDNRLDLHSLVDRLAELDDGDLIQVDAEEAAVRVWVSSS